MKRRQVLSALGAPFRAVGGGVKALAMRWSGQARSWWALRMPRSKFDYGKEVGDGRSSSIVVAVVNWMARTFPEAPLIVVEKKPDGSREQKVGHDLTQRLENPNPYYSGPLLWMATIVDWALSGNAYWLKVRSRADKVVQLWWVPSSMIEPRWPNDGLTFISHYDYKPDPARAAVAYDPRDVVHFRYGIDPLNTRKGLSQLRSLLREIFTDDEAANMTASLMRNIGVPGVLIAPDTPNVSVDKEGAMEIKDDFMAKVGGDKRGEPLVMTAPTKITMMSFSPEQMELKSIRRIPEERVTAVYGVAAVVVGLGAGLDRSTFNNFHEAREAGYEQNIIPTQRLMAADLKTQLLPDFDTNPSLDVAFDLTQVRVLQPDMDNLWERVNKGVNGGWFTVGQALREVGKKAGPEHDIYLRPMHIVEVAASKEGARSEDFPAMTNSAAQLIRAGFDPAEVLEALGLPPMTHLGLPPITVQPPPLDEGKSLKASFPDQLALTRRRLAQRFEGDLAKFFKGQSGRVRERMSGALGRNGKSALTANELLPTDEDGLLSAALRPLYLLALESGWETAGRAFGLGAEFAYDQPQIVAAIEAAQGRAERINGGTRRRISEALEAGTVAGYSLNQIADGVPGDDFRGLFARVEEGYKDFPLAVATTEAMWATNMGAASLYRVSGYQKVQMVDGGDHEPCASRNGRVVSIDAGMAASGEEHPHGTLSLVPVGGEGP